MGEWIEWNGGECPVDPETVVEVKFRGPAVGMEPDRDLAEATCFYWLHDNDCSDIIAYRVQP